NGRPLRWPARSAATDAASRCRAAETCLDDNGPPSGRDLPFGIAQANFAGHQLGEEKVADGSEGSAFFLVMFDPADKGSAHSRKTFHNTGRDRGKIGGHYDIGSNGWVRPTEAGKRHAIGRASINHRPPNHLPIA